jgi:hypothetical protein
MSEEIRDRKDREGIRRILTASLQVKGSFPEPRKAFDESWIQPVRDFKSAKGMEFNKQVVKEYLEEHDCSSHTIERFLKSVF